MRNKTLTGACLSMNQFKFLGVNRRALGGNVDLQRGPVGRLAGFVQGGQIFQGLQANPHMIDVAVRDFSVLAGPTKVTRGGY